MRYTRLKMAILSALFPICAFAQTYQTTIEELDNYDNWSLGKVFMMENGLIKVAIVPAVGAHIMEYSLDGHDQMWRNSDLYGKIYAPTNTWYNYGGYKTWPAPQSNWGGHQPPTLDYGPYTTSIVDNTQDSVSIFASGQVETIITPDLQFERKITIYNGTSRVKVDQTIKNMGSATQSWSIWDVTQCKTEFGSNMDNYWVYFPFKKNSVFGSDGVKTTKSSTAWKGEVAPGIYGVVYRNENKKIFADAPVGWITYVDENTGYTFAKTFKIWNGVTYPDGGANVEVWISKNYNYLEVEVLSPIVDLAPNGGSYTFTENWWAAKLNGPTRFVNETGATAQMLDYKKEGSVFTGEYGIFHAGEAQLVLLDGSGSVVAQGQNHAVSPKETFHLNESLALAASAVTAEVQITNLKGEFVGYVDRASLSILAGVSDQIGVPYAFELKQNYPNPFNPTTTIEFSLPISGFVSLKIFDYLGQEISTLVSEKLTAGNHNVEWNATGFTSGIYFYRLESDNGFVQSKKLILLK